MTIATISDVLTRISGIEQQIQQLQSGTLLDSQLGISGGSSPPAASGSSSSADFANQLAAAQQGSTGASTASAPVTGGSTLEPALYSSAISQSSSSAGSRLTSAQQQFASTLSADTGLNPNVVSAWLLAEESGGAAQSRQAAGNNDWLNIGYTDSGTYGSGDTVWSDPISAATATAAWLRGQDSIPGYGTASSGIQAILASVGQTPAAQIQAIQGSGWSSGGYPSLDSLYQQVAGSTSAAGASL